MTLTDIKYWLYHRFHPKHRYNIVRTGLPPGYYDPDERITHAAFAIFCEYYEEGAPAVCWEGSGKADVLVSMRRIYRYIKILRPFILLKNDPKHEYLRMELDKKYLHMIVSIIHHLWY